MLNYIKNSSCLGGKYYVAQYDAKVTNVHYIKNKSSLSGKYYTAWFDEFTFKINFNTLLVQKFG